MKIRAHKLKCNYNLITQTICKKHVIFFHWMAMLFLLSAYSPAFSQGQFIDTRYKDHLLSYTERVDILVSQMTLEEKVSQMMSRTPHDLTRFGIPGYEWSGMSAHNIERGDACTIFPHAIAQASTWDQDLIYEIGTALSDEARGLYNSGYPRMGLTFWAPVVEMARDPRWGRTHECYGEDPYLTAQIALQWVKGIQGSHPHYLKAIAAPKHFAANNEEWDRHNGSSNIDEQLLREYYLKPYEILIKEGQAMGIMAAYNRLNEVPCIANKMLLTDILRKDWGFKGTVVTDCNGIEDLYKGHQYAKDVDEAIAMAVNAGVDIECGNTFKDHLLEVVKSGKISEKTIDRAVKRIMFSRFMLGLYDPPDLVPFNKIDRAVADSEQHRLLAREAARKAIILLKNKGHLLPLDKETLKSVAIIGPNAAVCLMGGYTGKYSLAVSPLDGIRNKLGAEKVHYVKGTDVQIQLPAIPSQYLIPAHRKKGAHGLYGEYFNNTDCSGEPVFTRVDSVINFNFGKGSPDPRIHNKYYSIRWTGQFIAPESGPYFIGGTFDDAIRLWLDGKLIIDKSKNRNQNTAAVKVILKKGTHYRIGIEFTQHWYKSKITLGGAPPDPDKFDKAVSAAKNADVAILVIGSNEETEGEGRDRSDIKLPGDQRDLVEAVLKVNPKTIVVLQNGAPLSIPWIQGHVPAIIETFYNGEEGGNALADVLFGDYNPAGRLPLTVYTSVEQLPPFSDYDLRKGRTYMYPTAPDGSRIKPLYPFGFGLSYTDFQYGNLQLAGDQILADDTLQARIAITNTGKRTGEEVVQLYIHPKKSKAGRPVKQLVGFERIPLKPGETKTVAFSVPTENFTSWDVNKKAFSAEAGEYEIMAGSSSADIRSIAKFTVK